MAPTATNQVISKILKAGEKRELSELKDVISTTPAKILIDALKNQVHLTNGVNFWNYLLRGFSLLDTNESKEKRFLCVKAFLNELSSIELSYTLTYDLITRLCLDLTSFTNDQLIEIVEYSENCLRIGDPKCVGWKDLLPETLLILTNQANFTVNCVKMSGLEYRSQIIKNLITIKWPISVLTPLANMFSDLKLNNDETITVLAKFSKNIITLAPLELPALAFQLFSMCQTSSQIIIPIVAFEKFFHRYYYKKLFADMDSNTTDYNSIDEYSDKELREAEETIFHHLSFCTRFKISEQQMCIALRNLSSSSDIILTPFILSAVLSMTEGNREPDSWISSSPLLQFLKNVIKNNEDEKKLTEYSVWCRDTLQSRYNDLDQIFTVLIDQNKHGKDVVTPGLVNLAFILLRAKQSPKLNALGMNFLQKFIKKRFVFGHGVVKNLAEWMIVEQEALQYSECLTTLAISDTFTVSECVKTITYVLDFFLWIPGNHAMRMMSFVLPIVKISHTIRDYFIEILRKAINSKDLATCRLGVYGFCMLLKQLNNNNSQRALIKSGNLMTQQSISGFSLMSQVTTTIGNQTNPQKHFDMLTLEIIGCLRRCFNAQLEIKETLYENLHRAVELNPKLTPHILEFIEHHFRSYFSIDETECKIKFDLVIKKNSDDDTSSSSNENTNDLLQVHENLGQLTNFIGFATMICDKHELNYNTNVIKTILKRLIDEISSKNIELIQMTGGTLDHRKSLLALQQLNFLESLMCYAIWTSKSTNDNVAKIHSMFKEHKRISDGLKSFGASAANKKGSKKGKNPNESDLENMMTIKRILVKNVSILRNLWDLPTIERFLRLLFDDVISFANSSETAPLRSNRDLTRYILEVTASHIELIRTQPDYKQVTHSRRILKNLTEVTRVIYERCVKKLQNLWSNFDPTTAYLSVECLRQSLVTAQTVFKRKFDIYLKGIDFQTATQRQERIAHVLQNSLEKSIQDEDEFEADADGKKIPGILLQCLDVLYEFICFDDSLTLESYNWLFKFCQTYELHTKENGYVHKLLFSQRMKTHSGTFFNSIAMNLEKVMGKIDEQIESKPVFLLKSITMGTSESCLNHLLTIVKKQIEDVDFFINKTKSSLYKLKISAENEQELCILSLKTMERSISTQLVHLTGILLHLTNIDAPLGISMDNLIRLIIQFYNCLTNLTKHFISRNSILSISYQSIKFDQVLRVAGKPLASRIYNLISHVESKVLASSNNQTTTTTTTTTTTKKSKPIEDRAKILRETKLLPKLILHVENFNKFIILLSKKSNGHLTHFLHIGTVRDFRIKTSELKEAINETLTHGSQIEDNDELDNDDVIVLDRNESDDPNIENNDNLSIRRVHSENNDDSSNDSGEPVVADNRRESQGYLENESNTATNSQFLKNTAKVSEKIRKRKTLEDSESAENVLPPLEIIEDNEPKQKRGRRSKK